MTRSLIFGSLAGIASAVLVLTAASGPLGILLGYLAPLPLFFAGVGLATSVAVVYALLRGSRRVPLAQFFKYTGLLLIVIAAGLLSSGINLMQTVGWLPLPGALFDI